jgi:hypothetical protein
MHYSAESLKELQVLLLVPVDRSNECPIHVCDNGSSSNTFPSFPEDFTNLRVLLRLKPSPERLQLECIIDHHHHDRLRNDTYIPTSLGLRPP